MKKEYGIVFILTIVVVMIWVALRLENKLNENVYQEATINEGANEGVNKGVIINNEGVLIDTNTYIIPINQDSIDRVELIKDSITFRKITIKINGGLNGFADRYAMWLRARNSINK